MRVADAGIGVRRRELAEPDGRLGARRHDEHVVVVPPRRDRGASTPACPRSRRRSRRREIWLPIVAKNVFVGSSSSVMSRPSRALQRATSRATAVASTVTNAWL